LQYKMKSSSISLPYISLLKCEVGIQWTSLRGIKTLQIKPMRIQGKRHLMTEALIIYEAGGITPLLCLLHFCIVQFYSKSLYFCIVRYVFLGDTSLQLYRNIILYNSIWKLYIIIYAHRLFRGFSVVYSYDRQKSHQI